MDAAVYQAVTQATTESTTDPWHLALVAASSRAELDAGSALLRAQHDQLVAPGNELVELHAADLQIGRHRGAVLAGAHGVTVVPPEGSSPGEPTPVAFMFPGLGDQYLNMAQHLYRELPVFRRHVDKCADLLAAELGVNLREVIFAAGTDERLDRTTLAQPALFVIEYALAKVWQSLGVRPDIMIGYSLGEYVAACLAGVLSLKDALKVVARRAKLIEKSPQGSMLMVHLTEERLLPLLTDRVSLAGVNGASCMVAGHSEDVAALETMLAEDGVVTRWVRSAHALHSAMMAPLADAVTELVSGFKLKPPKIPFVSNVSGKPITDDEAIDPSYWARQLCSPVRFADGIASVGSTHALLETGPGQTLSSMAAATRDAERGSTGVIVASMRHSLEAQPDVAVLLKAFARLWAANSVVDWDSLPVSLLALPESAPIESIIDTERELTETERRLAGLWARLLQSDSLPVDVSFFELGGNELLATQLAHRVAKEFGVGLAVQRVYETSTIARMAAAIDASTSA